jgi:hypothetical protein
MLMPDPLWKKSFLENTPVDRCANIFVIDSQITQVHNMALTRIGIVPYDTEQPGTADLIIAIGPQIRP